MKIKCLIDYGISLKKGKLYEATKIQKGWYAIIDETREEYVYPPNIFEVVRHVSDLADINETIEERADGKGFWNRNKQQTNSRICDYILKINANNESYYLEHPKGGYIKFDNKFNSTLQTGKLIVTPKSIFYVDNQLNFLSSHIIEEAMRQIDVATLYGYEVEWLISNEIVVNQLDKFFEKNNILINVKFFPE